MKYASKMQAPIPPVMKTVLPRRQDQDTRSLSREIEDQYRTEPKRVPYKREHFRKTIDKVLHNTNFDSKNNSLQW